MQCKDVLDQRAHVRVEVLTLNPLTPTLATGGTPSCPSTLGMGRGLHGLQQVLHGRAHRGSEAAPRAGPPTPTITLSRRHMRGWGGHQVQVQGPHTAVLPQDCEGRPPTAPLMRTCASVLRPQLRT